MIVSWSVVGGWWGIFCGVCVCWLVDRCLKLTMGFGLFWTNFIRVIEYDPIINIAAAASWID